MQNHSSLFLFYQKYIKIIREWCRKMVFEEEIEEMKKLEEEIRQQRIKKVKKKKKPNIKNIKRIKTTTYIIGIIVFIGIALLVYQYDK